MAAQLQVKAGAAIATSAAEAEAEAESSAPTTTGATGGRYQGLKLPMPPAKPVPVKISTTVNLAELQTGVAALQLEVV